MNTKTSGKNLFLRNLYIIGAFAAICFFTVNGGIKPLHAEEFDEDYFSYAQTVEEGQTMSVDNDIVYVQDDITVEFGAELIFNGDCYLEDDIYIQSGGSLTVNNELISAGSIHLEDGASLIVNANLVNNGDITNYGEITVNGSMANYAFVNNYKSLTIEEKGELSNTGEIKGNGILSVKGEFDNAGSYLAGSIFVESVLDNKGSILLEKANLNNEGEINNHKDGRISLVNSCFYNENDESKLVNNGNFDSSNASKIYNQGLVEIKADGHLVAGDFYNYNEVDNHGAFDINGNFESRNGKLVNYGALNNLGRMNFTYYSDFEQSKESSYTGNMYECVYSYGATAIFNGSVTGYVVVALASIAACLIVVRIRIVKKAKNDKSGE